MISRKIFSKAINDLLFEVTFFSMGPATFEGASKNNISNDIRIWLKRHQYLATYLLLLIISVSLIFLLNPLINNSQIFVDNARNTLSILIQTQGAIIAIVITLTLVLVQTLATTNSAKIVNYVTRKNPDVLILLISYIGAILYGLWLINNLPPDDAGFFINQVISPELNNYVLFGYGLGIFTLLMLVPYFLRITKLLRIDQLLKEISDEIDDENISLENESLSLFFDIIQTQIVRNNFSDVRYGIQEIGRKLTALMYNNPKESEKQIEIICNNIISLGQIATSVGNDQSTLNIIQMLSLLGENSIKNNKNKITYFVVRSLFLITINSVDHKLYNSSLIGIVSLGDLGRLSEINNNENTDYIIERFGEIGYSAANNKMEWATTQVASELSKIGKERIKNQKNEKNNKILFLLSECLNESIKNNLDATSDEILKILEDLGTYSAEVNNDFSTKFIVGEIGEVTLEIIQKKNINLLMRYIYPINQIVKKSLNPILPQTVLIYSEISQLIIINANTIIPLKIENQFLPILENIGKSALNLSNLEFSTEIANSICSTLIFIGDIEIKKRDKDVLYDIAKKLLEIGKLAYEKGKYDVSARSINYLSILCGKTIEEGIVNPLSHIPYGINLNEIKNDVKDILFKSEYENIDKDIQIFIITEISEIATRAIEANQKYIIKRSTIGLSGICISAMKKEYKSIFIQTLSELYNIGISAIKPKFEDVCINIIHSLTAILFFEEVSEDFKKAILLPTMLLSLYAKDDGMDTPMDYEIEILAAYSIDNEELISDVFQILRDDPKSKNIISFNEFYSEFEKKCEEIKEKSI